MKAADGRVGPTGSAVLTLPVAVLVGHVMVGGAVWSVVPVQRCPAGRYRVEMWGDGTATVKAMGQG